MTIPSWPALLNLSLITVIAYGTEENKLISNHSVTLPGVTITYKNRNVALQIRTNTACSLYFNNYNLITHRKTKDPKILTLLPSEGIQVARWNSLSNAGTKITFPVIFIEQCSAPTIELSASECYKKPLISIIDNKKKTHVMIYFDKKIRYQLLKKPTVINIEKQLPYNHHTVANDKNITIRNRNLSFFRISLKKESYDSLSKDTVYYLEKNCPITLIVPSFISLMIGEKIIDTFNIWIDQTLISKNDTLEFYQENNHIYVINQHQKHLSAPLCTINCEDKCISL